jgi:small-conductance mechanosensitive channel
MGAGDAMIRIKQAFDANGIIIPFPTRVLEFARGIKGLSADSSASS